MVPGGYPPRRRRAGRKPAPLSRAPQAVARDLFVQGPARQAETFGRLGGRPAGGFQRLADPQGLEPGDLVGQAEAGIRRRRARRPVHGQGRALGLGLQVFADVLDLLVVDEGAVRAGTQLLTLAAAGEWEAAGRLALLGIGVEPGLSDVFARYAAAHLFSSIDELGTRDGANLVVRDEDGNEVFAPGFSMWTIIEECLNPPVVWERARAEADGITIARGNLTTIDPLAYPDMVNAVINAAGVVTDSGGLQKEAFLLGTICTTVRTETEWVETVENGWNVLDPDAERLGEYATRPQPKGDPGHPYGDGKAARSVAAVLLKAGERDRS